MFDTLFIFEIDVEIEIVFECVLRIFARPRVYVECLYQKKKMNPRSDERAPQKQSTTFLIIVSFSTWTTWVVFWDDRVERKFDNIK